MCPAMDTNPDVYTLLSSVCKDTLKRWQHDGEQHSLGLMQELELGENIIYFSGKYGYEEVLTFPNKERYFIEPFREMTLPNIHFFYKMEPEKPFGMDIVVEDHNQKQYVLRFGIGYSKITQKADITWLPLEAAHNWSQCSIDLKEILDSAYQVNYSRVCMLRIKTTIKLRKIFMTELPHAPVCRIFFEDPKELIVVPKTRLNKQLSSQYRVNRAAQMRIAFKRKKKELEEKQLVNNQISEGNVNGEKKKVKKNTGKNGKPNTNNGLKNKKNNQHSTYKKCLGKDTKKSILVEKIKDLVKESKMNIQIDLNSNTGDAIKLEHKNITNLNEEKAKTPDDEQSCEDDFHSYQKPVNDKLKDRPGTATSLGKFKEKYENLEQINRPIPTQNNNNDILDTNIFVENERKMLAFQIEKDACKTTPSQLIKKTENLKDLVKHKITFDSTKITVNDNFQIQDFPQINKNPIKRPNLKLQNKKPEPKKKSVPQTKAQMDVAVLDIESVGNKKQTHNNGVDRVLSKLSNNQKSSPNIITKKKIQAKSQGKKLLTLKDDTKTNEKTHESTKSNKKIIKSMVRKSDDGVFNENKVEALDTNTTPMNTRPIHNRTPYVKHGAEDKRQSSKVTTNISKKRKSSQDMNDHSGGTNTTRSSH